jgi:hypothetical protein
MINKRQWLNETCELVLVCTGCSKANLLAEFPVDALPLTQAPCTHLQRRDRRLFVLINRLLLRVETVVPTSSSVVGTVHQAKLALRALALPGLSAINCVETL